jgi:CBS domain-containing protein
MSAFLRLIPPPVPGEPANVCGQFHSIGRVLPETQDVAAVGTDERIRDALALMAKEGFSQLPVIESGRVFGVFSHRSLSRKVSKLHAGKHDPLDAAVEEAMDVVDASWFVQVDHELKDVLACLDRNDAVLVGTANRLQGIVTTIDVLRYLHRVSNRFVYLEEIELAVRTLLRLSMSEEEIAEAARLTLVKSRDGDPPSRLEDMAFHDYIQIIDNGRFWEKLDEVFGGTRDRTRVKLKAVSGLRNVVFHFKRPLTEEDDQTLQETRDWLLFRARLFDCRSAPGGSS